MIYSILRQCPYLKFVGHEISSHRGLFQSTTQFMITLQPPTPPPSPSGPSCYKSIPTPRMKLAATKLREPRNWMVLVLNAAFLLVRSSKYCNEHVGERRHFFWNSRSTWLCNELNQMFSFSCNNTCSPFSCAASRTVALEVSQHFLSWQIPML